MSRLTIRSQAPVFAVTIVMLSLGVACTGATQTLGLEGGASQASNGPAGKVVVALSPLSTGTVDPALEQGTLDFANIEPLYNRLLENPKDSLELAPGIATKWNVSPDGKTVEFTIRDGVRFHNGDILAPEDVVFSMERTRRISNPGRNPYFQRVLQSVEATGDSVVFHLKEPDWTFLSTLARTPVYSIVPKKYVEQVGDGGFLKAPVGTGPFKFVSGSKQEYLDLEAVDYEHFLWRPGVKQLRNVMVSEETTRLAMLRTGEADLAQVSVPSLQGIQGDSKLRVLKVPNIGGLQIYMFGQGDSQNPLSKVEVRRALSLAIDRAAIANGVYRGNARAVGTAMWNPSQPGFPEWGLKPAPYDMDKAKELLAAAGYPGGKEIKLTFHNAEYSPTPLGTQVATVIASAWQKLGVEVELRSWEWGAYLPLSRSGKFGSPANVSIHASNFPGDTGGIMGFTRTGSYAHASGTADGAYPTIADMAEQFVLELDPAKRDALRDKILAFDRDNVVSIPLIIQDGLWAAGPRLLEYTPKLGFLGAGNMYTIKVTP